LYSLGLYHADLHGKNIIVTRTAQPAFQMDASVASRCKAKIPFVDGLQLVAIDYGGVSKKGRTTKNVLSRLKWCVVSLLTDMFSAYDRCAQQSKEDAFDSYKNILNLVNYVFVHEKALLHSIMRSVDPTYIPAFRTMLDFCEKHMSGKHVSSKTEKTFEGLVSSNSKLLDVVGFIDDEFLHYTPNLHHAIMKCCSAEPIIHCPPPVIRDVMYCTSVDALFEIVCSLAM